MRIESSVTSLSWIPTEAVSGFNKVVFGTGFTHYDTPPPDTLGDLEALRSADRFRFANHLVGWAEVEDGRIVDAGYGGSGLMGATTVAVGAKRATFAAVSFPDLQQPVELGGSSVRFVQTTGGHTALPAPRRVSRPPFVAFSAPTVWVTLALTLHADGRVEHEIVGASAFPRHWVYDARGELATKVGMADFKQWWRRSFGRHTPWGDEESAQLVTEVETALERQVADQVMQGGRKPTLRSLEAGAVLTEQGSPGDELYLVLNGVLGAEVDGEPLADVGPGAVVGERAVLEGGDRTATLVARTPVKVAVMRADEVDTGALRAISEGHRREDLRVADPAAVDLDPESAGTG